MPKSQDDEEPEAMSEPYGMDYPTAQWGHGDDEFHPPYTQDPPQNPAYPTYAQPTVAGTPAQAVPPPPPPGVQPVYVPYPVAVPGQQPGGGMAIASLVLGIISAAFGWIVALIPICGIIALAPAILGIVFGVLGVRSPQRRGMAIAGLTLSVIGFVVAMVLSVGFFFL